MAGKQWVYERAEEMAQDDKWRKQASEWIGGEFSGDHYTEVDLALLDLHSVHPADLIDSPLLPRLYALAKTVNAAYMAWFTEQALDLAERNAGGPDLEDAA